MKSDFYVIFMECVNGEFSFFLFQWYIDRFVVGVVVVSGGYFGLVKKGCIIKGLKDLEVSFVFICNIVLVNMEMYLF